MTQNKQQGQNLYNCFYHNSDIRGMHALANVNEVLIDLHQFSQLIGYSVIRIPAHDNFHAFNNSAFLMK